MSSLINCIYWQLGLFFSKQYLMFLDSHSLRLPRLPSRPRPSEVGRRCLRTSCIPCRLAATWWNKSIKVTHVNELITRLAKLMCGYFARPAFLQTQFPRSRCVAKARCYNKSDPVKEMTGPNIVAKHRTQHSPPQLKLIYYSNTKPHQGNF